MNVTDRARTVETRQFLSFMWAGQNGSFELDNDPSHRSFWSLDDALANLDGKTLFAPLARTRRRGRKIDVNPTGNVLWIDIDSRDAPERVQERLLPLGLEPSVLVDSGNKGYWVYFKLTNLIPTDEVEALNRGLADLLDGDRCGNRDRIARLPNSLHPKSGKLARIVEFSSTSYPPDAFKDISRLSQPRIDVSENPALTDNPSARLAAFGEFPALSPRLWQYITSRPKWNPALWDRSAVEFQIFQVLIAHRWSDEQIVAFADAYRLPRHMEERRRDKQLNRNPYAWTHRTIRNARKVLAKQAVGDTHYLSPMCIEPRTRQPCLDRYEVLPLIRGQSTSALVAEVIELLGSSRRARLRRPATTRSRQLHRT